MKKGIYSAILAIVTVACIIGGTIYHMSGFGHSVASHIFSFGFADDEKLVGVEGAETLEAFDSVSVDLSVTDFTIKSGSEYSLTYNVAEELEPQCSVENGVLTIKQKTENNWNFGLYNVTDGLITLTVPRDVSLESLTLSSDVGDVEIFDVRAEKTDVSANVGDITVENAELGDSWFNLDTGDLEIKHSTFADLDVTSSVGDVEISAAKDLSDYNLDLSTDVGEVEVNGRDQGDMCSVTGSGNYKITVKSDVGDVDLDW